MKRFTVILAVLLSLVATQCLSPVVSLSSPKEICRIERVIKSSDVDPALAEFLAPVVWSAGKKYCIDPRLIAAILQRETNFTINVKGKAGEIGIAQIMPNHWCKTLGITKKELGDPTVNIFSCARILSILKQDKKTWWQTVKAYNGSSRKATVYANQVLKTYNNYLRIS